MLSTPLLPQEILVPIVHFFKYDPQALLNLCLTSSAFIGEARNLLYSDIRIDKLPFAMPQNSSPISTDLAKSDKLFMSLTTHNTSLAALVQSFSYLTDFPHYDEEYMNLVNRTFRSMINLKHLNLSSGVITPRLFDGCNFQLGSLCCTGISSLRHGRHPASRDEISHFLSTQPYLKSLFIDWEAGVVPSTSCPNLETIRGDYHFVLYLLRGRSTVRHLEWIRDNFGLDEDLFASVRQLSAEFSNITILALGGLHYHFPLGGLIPYLTSLRVLRLMGFVRDEEPFELEHDIPRFPNLRTFVWSVGGFVPSSPRQRTLGQDQEQQRVLTETWFTKTDTLDKAYFQVHDERLGANNYACWRRGKIGPTYFNYNEALVANGLCSWSS